MKFVENKYGGRFSFETIKGVPFYDKQTLKKKFMPGLTPTFEASE